MPFLLGIDNGGTMAKAGLYDIYGNVAALSCADIPSVLGRNGEVERDLDQFWAVNCRVIKHVIEKAKVNASEIVCVSVSGHGNGIYLVDKSGKPLGNGINSTDTRAKKHVEYFEQSGVCERIFPKTMQTLYPGQLAPLLTWLSEYEPERLEQAGWAFGCIDYVRFCLTGIASAEITNMSAACVLNQHTRDYDDEILQEMGIADCRRILPPLKKSCEITGRVSAEAAKQTGLAEGTPVAGGMIDITACAIATGITNESRLCVIAGTWSINEFITRKPLVAKGLLLTSVYCIPGYYMVTDGSMTSASNLDWFLHSFFESEVASGSVYEVTEKMIDSVQPQDSDIIFLPFLFATNADVNAKSCFIGLSGWHSREHLLRAIFEGIVFSHKVHVERLLELREPPQAIRMAGGVTKSKAWVQMFADIMQLPIEISDSTELGTMGAAMCAGVASGIFADLGKASAELTNIIRTCQPDPAQKEVYARKYLRYKKAIKNLSPIWQEW